MPYAFYRSRDYDPARFPWASFLDEDSPRLVHVKALECVQRKGERVRFGSGDIWVLLAAIRAGIGKGLLPVCLAERELGLMRVEPGPPDLIRVLHLHLHPGNVQAKRVQAVTRCLREEVEATFGEPWLAVTASAS